MPLNMFPLGPFCRWKYIELKLCCNLYSDAIMSVMASQITSFTIVYTTVYSGADQRKHQISSSLVFVRGIHRWPVNYTHKGPVTRKMLPFDDVIMCSNCDQVAYFDIWQRLVINSWLGLEIWWISRINIEINQIKHRSESNHIPPFRQNVSTNVILILTIDELWNNEKYKRAGFSWYINTDIRNCNLNNTMASFTKEVNPRVAKRLLVFNGHQANRWLTSFVKEAIENLIFVGYLNYPVLVRYTR